jgi:hypothetical protein
MVGYESAPLSGACDINRKRTFQYNVKKETTPVPLETGDDESSDDETKSEQRVPLDDLVSLILYLG